MKLTLETKHEEFREEVRTFLAEKLPPELAEAKKVLGLTDHLRQIDNDALMYEFSDV